MDWHEKILSEFPPGVHPLTLVEDADGLLAEERVQGWLREQGFDVVRFDDSVAFRYVHESSFRVRLEQGKATNLVVVFGAGIAPSLPFDLLAAGHRVSVGLRELFPTLSQRVVAAMDPADLGALHEACERVKPGTLGDDATKDFALRHVFGVDVDAAIESHDLLGVLLRLHYSERRMPRLVVERFLAVLRHNGHLADWPLESIVGDRSAFFAFLQEHWPAFVERTVGSDSDGEDRPARVEASSLPFGHADVRVYIDNLFLEGHLQPIDHLHAGRLAQTWLRVGVRGTDDGARADRLERLLERAETAIPSGDARYRDWLGFARIWGELLGSALAVSKEDDRAGQLRGRVDAAFDDWLHAHYAGLANLPSVPPVMLHHIPRALSRELDDGTASKVALVVVDGLSVDQWVVVRSELARQRPSLHMQQDAVFAWIPTITAVSRQAAFAGVPPFGFPSSIQGTASEPSLWRRFWERENIGNQQVCYVKGLGKGGLDDVEDAIAQPNVRVAGLVVDTVDKIMHGMELGARGMHNQVRQWAAEGHLAQLLDLLLEHGFCVYLTSDHGNIEAQGCGRLAEGATAEVRGERVRVYADDSLRRRWSEQLPDAVAWPSVGLPDDYQPLLAPGRMAFVGEGERIVCHGGACIEEVIVPLVRIVGGTP